MDRSIASLVIEGLSSAKRHWASQWCTGMLGTGEQGHT
jgi:hypothetical protein